jgi:hypothetical protein
VSRASSQATINIIEIKTGDSPTFTPTPRVAYPLATIGGHVYSDSPRIGTFGFAVGAPLPAMSVYQVYAAPGENYRVTPIIPEFEK